MLVSIDSYLDNIHACYNNTAMADSYKLNPEILKQCRRQIGLDDIEEAKKATKVEALAQIENGKKSATLRQQEKLADAYSVPSWVFFEKSLPAEYDFSKGKDYTEFRTLKDSQPIIDYKLNKVILYFSNCRKNLLSIYEDEGRDAIKFNPPQHSDVHVLTREVKKWLGYQGNDFLRAHKDNRAIDYWKDLIEKQGVLVFTTSSFPHWSKVDTTAMRGLAIYHEILPIIIINGGDYFRANLFTLMHELAHLIQRRTSLHYKYRFKERSCDEFASEILLPDKEFKHIIDQLMVPNFDLLEVATIIEKKYGVSKLAVAMKMLVSGKIDPNKYLQFENTLKELHEKSKTQEIIINRQRPKEIINFYGKTYTKEILQLYNDQEITLNKVCSALDIKKVEYLEGIQKQI